MKNQEKLAYVTFIMRNDSFVPGALVLGYRLRKISQQADLVCLVTKDISEIARQGLREIYDHVVLVEELYVTHKRHHERQDRPYLFTRFQALRLGRDGDLGLHYDKIVLLDADIMPLGNYDDLFQVPAPAGIINEYKHHCIEEGPYKRTDKRWIWHDTYDQICRHGKQIPREITDRVWQNPENMGVNASLWVLKPTVKDLEEIMRLVNCPCILDKISQFNWPEMQFATLFWSGKWHNVDLKYSAFNSQPNLKIIHGTHFAGFKPWNEKKMKSLMHYFKFDDYQMWYMELYEMAKWVYPKLMDLPKIKRLVRLYETKLRSS